MIYICILYPSTHEPRIVPLFPPVGPPHVASCRVGGSSERRRPRDKSPETRRLCASSLLPPRAALSSLSPRAALLCRVSRSAPRCFVVSAPAASRCRLSRPAPRCFVVFAPAASRGRLSRSAPRCLSSSPISPLAFPPSSHARARGRLRCTRRSASSPSSRHVTSRRVVVSRAVWGGSAVSTRLSK